MESKILHIQNSQLIRSVCFQRINWSYDKVFKLNVLRVSFLHLHQCVLVDKTPSSYVCCGKPHGPTPCAVQSVHKTRHAAKADIFHINVISHPREKVEEVLS